MVGKIEKKYMAIYVSAHEKRGERKEKIDVIGAKEI